MLNICPLLAAIICSEFNCQIVAGHLTHFSSLSVLKIATLNQKFDARLANRPFSVSDFRTLWRSGS